MLILIPLIFGIDDAVFWSYLAPALIGVLAGVLTNRSNESNVASTNDANQQIAQDTNRAQTLLSQQQHAWNVQDWQMQASYDSPSAQMARFRDAGLNPGLIFGQMSQGPSINSTEQPNLQMAHMQPFLAQNPMENMDPLSIARMRNIEANTEYIESQTETENFMRQARYDNLTAATSNLYKQNEEVFARIQRMAKENELTGAQINNISFEQYMRQSEYLLDYQRLENESNLTAAQISKLNADTRKALAEAQVTERQFKEMCYTFAIRYAQLDKNVRLTQAQIGQANATARKLGIEGDILDWKAEGKRYKLSEMRGENGKINEVGSTAAWLIEDIFSWMGSVLH